jgi:hypothetical protein
MQVDKCIFDKFMTYSCAGSSVSLETSLFAYNPTLIRDSPDRF